MTKPLKTATEVIQMAADHRALIVGLVLLASSQGNATAALANPNRHRSFADELTTILYTKENECSSSLGVSMAFSLIYPGSRGCTILEML
mmetsp:Transcript_33972/g.62491  ORF Transcript_33972/g.62491 Transcript_33972/m.62491 type:complete len:90 (-) Transcript_33972:161-430(-)